VSTLRRRTCECISPPDSQSVRVFFDCCRIRRQIVAVSGDYSLQCGQGLRSFLAVNAKCRYLPVVLHVVLCVIICSCIFHPSSWSSIFRFSIFHLLTFQLSWSCIFGSLLSHLLFLIGPPFSGPPFLPRDASAERGDATVSRLSVCPSVRL